MILDKGKLQEKGFKPTIQDDVYEAIQAMNDACQGLISEKEERLIGMLIGVGRQHEEDWDPADLVSGWNGEEAENV
jgi:hypothetical protein